MRGLEKLSTMISDPSQWVKIKLPDLYANYRGVGEYSDVARILFEQSNWFCCAVDFDPKSGQALPQSLSSVLSKIARYSSPETGALVRDRLLRITEHSRASVERLFRALNETPRCEQALLPVHAVRELDATSFIKLSNRPGRNIREKLAGKPYLQAVRRFQSVDLPENRLLKRLLFALRNFSSYAEIASVTRTTCSQRSKCGCAAEKRGILLDGTTCRLTTHSFRIVITDAYGMLGAGCLLWTTTPLVTCQN